MTVITRFAPSPTGYLHVGNIRTALINWLFARKNGGKFILRIDDTDRERSKQEYIDGIFRDLEWLGLTWDELHYQSKRTDLHEAAKQKMIGSGRLYPCFETAEELEVKKKTALSRNLPPIYDRASLKLSKDDVAQKIAGGQNPHYRFLMKHESIDWHDGVKGAQHFDARHISDPVLVRTDGTMTYMIATVADDIDLKITNIIRGEDHITNSAVHMQMFQALGATPPSFAHLAHIQSKDGKISKRLGGFDIATMRENGLHPLAILSFLAKIGSSKPVEFRLSYEELIADFDIGCFSKSPTNYAISELERVNEKLTHNMPFQAAQSYLSSDVTENFWLSVRPNLEVITDANSWWKICHAQIQPKIAQEDADFLKQSAEILPSSNWDESTWGIWTANLKEQTGRTGKSLFMPLRLAITGEEHGPEMKSLLPLIARDKVVNRLKGEVA